MAKAKQPSLGGQFDAWVREGAKDLYNAIVLSDPNTMRPVDEPGTPLNPTQSMVTDDLKKDSFEAEVKQAAQVKAPNKEKEVERDMG